MAEIRGRKDIDRDALAKRLRFHPLKMWRLETGKTHFTADDLRKVASVLEVSIEDLFAPPSTSAGAAA